MATRRRKSLADIIAQVSRINRMARQNADQTSADRLSRATRVANTYRQNIENSASYQNARTAGLRAVAEANSEQGLRADRKRTRAFERGINAVERRYSQRTYMGLSAG